MNLNIKLNEALEVEKYPYYLMDLYRDNPSTSFPSPMTVEVLAAYRVYPVTIGTPPDGGLTHQVVEITPAFIEGEWTQQWELVPLDPEVVAINLEAAEAKRQSDLWEAAHNYEKSFISGVGLSILAVGFAMGKPKALAVGTWSNQLWEGTYYPRKVSGSTDFDFSVVGPMPYSVTELSAEIVSQP